MILPEVGAWVELFQMPHVIIISWPWLGTLMWFGYDRGYFPKAYVLQYWSLQRPCFKCGTLKMRGGGRLVCELSVYLGHCFWVDKLIQLSWDAWVSCFLLFFLRVLLFNQVLLRLTNFLPEPSGNWGQWSQPLCSVHEFLLKNRHAWCVKAALASCFEMKHAILFFQLLLY